MDIRIVLDPHNQLITTGDVITGRVVLDVKKRSNVTAVDIKLRGYIRTKWQSESDLDKPYHDKHEFLRLVQTLLPSQQARKGFWGSSVTLNPGRHEFAFEFKIPPSTTCGKKATSERGAETRSTCNRAPTHQERGLPPSFTQESDEIDIAYCLKATAARPDLFKGSLQTTYYFNFRPIEQAWDPIPQLTSIKHQHQFDLQRTVESSDVSADDGDDEYFPDMVRTVTAGRELASILVDARLPKPAVLFCNHDVPLDITIRKVNAFAGQLYLQSLQVTLIGYTALQTPAATRRNVDTWIVMSNCNLDIPIGTPEDPAGAPMSLPPVLWRAKPVPASVTPSFDVCGVSRHYELEITLGLTYESPNTARPGTVWLPLRQPVDIYPDFPALHASPANVSLEKFAVDDGYADHDDAQPAEEYSRAPPSYEVATATPPPV